MATATTGTDVYTRVTSHIVFDIISDTATIVLVLVASSSFFLRR